jgi:hypothetical protein
MSTDIETSRVHRKVEREHRQLVKEMERGPLNWILPRFVSGSLLGIGLTLVLPGFMGGGLGVFDPSSPVFWIKLLGPVVVAAVGTPFLYFKARQRSMRSPEEAVRHADKEVALLIAPGWIGRVFRLGGLAALGIGLPAGAILAFGLPVEELPGGSRLVSLGAFVLATAGWVIPGAFALRWAMVKRWGGKGHAE